jgi:hypothetical protein
MKKEETLSKKGAPIVIEQAGMRMTVDHRRSGSGDEGLTFDIVVAGAEQDENTILRFDCFYKNPHYHIGPSGKHPVRHMKEEGIEDPVGWTLEQLKTRLPSMVADAGYDEIAKRIDQQAIADHLQQFEPEIRAKF